MISIRKIGGLGRRYRHFQRYRQILGIIFKYGFGNVIDALNIDQYIEIGLKLISRNKTERFEKLSGAMRIRMIFEELGPTFIKFGQILSSRPDLIPVNLLTELARLQDRVPPFPFDEVAGIISSEFGRPHEEIFEYMDRTPIASASIGQVHRAGLAGVGEVAVKVQRPGIRKLIEVDLEIMHHLATLAETHVEEIAPHRPVRMVEEFAKSLSRELDYSVEASNMERMARQFASDPTVHIPGFFKEESSLRVLTMEFIRGVKISAVGELDRQGMDRRAITQNGAQFVMKQVFDHGFFHADPHPGNLFVLPGNVICPVDFGMAGFVPRQTREIFVDLIHCVYSKNMRLGARFLLELAEYDTEPDLGRLEKDMTEFAGLYLEKPLKEIRIGQVINDVLETSAHHGLRIPPDLFLMMKAFAAVEGVAKSLDPDFDMIAAAVPYVRAAKLSRLSPKRVSEDVMGVVRESLRFARLFPSDFLELLRLAKLGKFGVNVRIEGLDRMLSTYDQISNRIAFAIIIAALIMGSAQVINSDVPPFVFGVSLIGIAGFIAAVLMGIWLLVAILKKGRL
ncbi:MAG: AarF/ABC1/UbiB kinase family protein [Desulfobacteraceae bacterium]|nr:AarF/ABC1/UbiB kinase family protein [Desulfobacteraceae bacterium]